jgi:hypothetical protein
MAHTTIESRQQLHERVAGRTRSAAGSPLTAIRRKCVDCAAGRKAIALCPSTDCPLWLFRYGMKPETAAKNGKPMDPARAGVDGN